MEQFAHGNQRVVHRDRAVAVDGAVAERVDHPRLAEHRLARGLLEARLVDQRAQIVLIGQLQRGVVLVGPCHRQLERATGVEARCARVGVHRRLGLAGGLEHGRPFALEEGEMAHFRPSSSRMSQPRVTACHSSLS